MIEFDTRWLIVVFVVIAVSAGAGGASTYAAFTDTERATLPIRTTADFTVALGSAIIQPSEIGLNNERDMVSTYLNVSRPMVVNESGFTLYLADQKGEIKAVRGQCETPGSNSTSETWTCKAVFERRAILELTNHSEGTYDVVIHGWWEYHRDFVAVGQLTVTEDGNTTLTATLTAF